MTTLVLEHLQHADSASPDITIDSSGRVGIGTSSPSTQLEVKGSTFSLIRVNGGNTNKAGIDFGDTDDVDIGRIRYDNSSDAMQFWTNNAERMRIDSSGNVGIGTSSLSRTLTVSDTTSRGTVSIISANTQPAIILFGDSDADSVGQIRYDNNDNSLAFRVNSTERMRIDSSGNVGIGTSSSAARLSFGNYIPSNGQTIHTYEDGNVVSGLGIVAGVHRMFTNDGASLSYGHVSVSDGSAYTERMKINSSGTLNVISSDVVLGGGGGANTSSYTSAANSSDFKRFETDGAHFNSSVFSNPAIMGPNKLAVYDEPNWKGGIGLGSGEMQYYTGASHSFYKHTGTALTKHMEITDTGAITTPAQPAFVASTTSSLDITTKTIIPYNSNLYDRATNFNTANHRFTAPVTGLYTFTTYHWHKSGTGGTTHLYLYLNGSVNFEYRNTRASSSHNEYNRVGFTTTLAMSVNDYVHVEGSGASGGQLHTSAGVAYSHFSGYLIG
jgi:hypothetical protein